MNFIENVYRIIDKLTKNVKDDDHIYLCSIDLEQPLVSFKSVIDKCSCMKNTDDCDKSSKAFFESVSILSNYVNVKEYVSRRDVLLSVFRKIGLCCFARKDDSIYVSSISKDETETCDNFAKISELFKNEFGATLKISKTNSSSFLSDVEEIINESKQFYLNDKSGWILEFIENLQDEISKDSFKTFLKQRIQASVFDDSPIAYPILPPSSTSSWREQRENLNYDFPKLCNAVGEKLEDLYYKCIYVYDQYSIENVVEANKGDVVADIGAFIGDTSIYFSRKVGDQGKVLAFEISPDSIEIGRKNMLANGGGNVEYINSAITDKNGYLQLSVNSTAISSTNSVLEITNEEQADSIKVKSTSLDSFCEENGIVINFIKADIEGAEMSMLRGATRIIKKHSPTIAICLYHKKDDFWEIPSFIHSLNPKYKFWFRCEAEPVLFAKVP